MPALLFAGAWILMAMGYTYSGVTKLVSPSWLDGTAVARVLENPLARPGPLRAAILSLPDGLLRLGTWATLALELLFAPLALSRRLRPWIWTMALAMHLGLIALIDFADLSLGMVMLHLFTFDPAWVPAVKPSTTETLFYDGQCGLCHNAVRFLLAEDRAPGGAFRFAPLGGETFQATVSRPADLPDSLALVTDDGRVLTRSRAVLHLGRRLGGLWRVIAGSSDCCRSRYSIERTTRSLMSAIDCSLVPRRRVRSRHGSCGRGCSRSDRSPDRGTSGTPGLMPAQSTWSDDTLIRCEGRDERGMGHSDHRRSALTRGGL